MTMNPWQFVLLRWGNSLIRTPDHAQHSHGGALAISHEQLIVVGYSLTRIFLISMTPNSAWSVNGVAFAPTFDIRTVSPSILCSIFSPVTMISKACHWPSLTLLFSLLSGTMSNFVPRRNKSLLHFGPGL